MRCIAEGARRLEICTVHGAWAVKLLRVRATGDAEAEVEEVLKGIRGL